MRYIHFPSEICREVIVLIFSLTVVPICEQLPCEEPNTRCEPSENGLERMCVCRQGYHEESDVCVLSDECAGDHSCHEHATCSSTRAGHDCSCKTGFEGDGRSCIGELIT